MKLQANLSMHSKLSEYLSIAKSNITGTVLACADPEEGTGGPDTPPPEKSKTIGVISNAGPDTLEKNKATKPAFNVGP